MAVKKIKKVVVLPTDEEIKKLKGDFELKLKTIPKERKENKASPKRMFLRKLKDSISQAVKDGCSLRDIQESIKEIYKVEISLTLVSSFINEEIKLDRKKIKPKSTKKDTVTNKKCSKSSFEIKEELANEDSEDEEEISL